MNTSATTLGDFISYRDNIIGNSEFNTAANLGFNDSGTAAPLWDKAGGSAGSATFTPNTTETTDPNGGNTAAKYEWGTGSGAGTNWLRQETELASGVEVTFSAYYKQLGSQTTVRHNYWKGNSDVNVVLDFSNGTISEAPSGGTAPTSSAVENVGNGWYRVSMVLTTVAGTTENKAQPARQPVGVTGGGVYVWGAMLEVGNTLGTYVKTTSEIPNGVATVHTWYDQAGSKDATKITAANQPKISTGSQVLTANETGSQSLYAVCNVTDGASGYIAGSADDDSSGKIGQSIYYYTTTDKFVLSNGSTATNTTVDNISAIRGSNVLVSFNYNNNNTDTLNQNANQYNYLDGTDTYDFEAGSNFIIGARGGTVQAGRALNGSIQEVIVYNSDQTDNRFKIESNINNYYNLYNDEYEWHSSNTEWQNSVTNGSTTFSANGKDGFTITATGENIANFKFAYQSPSTATNNYYKVSFMVDDPNGLFDTAQLRTTATGSGATAQSIVNGFNSLKLKTPANGNFISINIDAGGSSKTATLSNFKASLINRNGYVETLYDQSDNANHVDQAVAGKQPGIVLNGGQVKVGNRASMKFDGTNDFLERTTYTQGTIAQINTIFSVAKLEVFEDDNRKVYDSHTSTARNMLFLSPNGNGEFGHYAGTVATTGQNADANQHLFTSRLNGAASRLYIDGVQKSTSNTGDLGMQGIVIGANHEPTGNYWNGDIQEIIIYNSDQNADRENQQNDINDYYTIY